MEILNQIKTKLDNNNFLQSNVKDDLYKLIEKFNEVYPEVKLDVLISKIETLKIDKFTSYGRKGPIIYNVEKNEILLSIKGLEEDYDISHMMMKGIIAIIASKDDFYGFNRNNSLYALNIGFTEMLANSVIGNEGLSDFEEEVLVTNLVSKIIGRDIMFDAYFNNDAEIILKKLLEAEVG